MTADETLNELLVCLFKDLTEIEGRCLTTDEFSDISINDMHIIEAIGVDEPKRSGTVAKLMSITLGTLTKAIDGLTRKGYVNRIRSEEDKRVVKLSLTGTEKQRKEHCGGKQQVLCSYPGNMPPFLRRPGRCGDRRAGEYQEKTGS